MKKCYMLITWVGFCLAFYSSIAQGMQKTHMEQNVAGSSREFIGNSIVRPSAPHPYLQPPRYRPHSADDSIRLPSSPLSAGSSPRQHDSEHGRLFRSISALTLEERKNEKNEFALDDDDAVSEESGSLNLAKASGGKRKFTYQNHTIHARFDIADSAGAGLQELCIGTIFDDREGVETYVFEFTTPPQCTHDATKFIPLGHLTPNRDINLNGVMIPVLQTWQQLKIMYCPHAPIFALACSDEAPREEKTDEEDEQEGLLHLYTAQTPHINTAPSLAALLELLPELLNILLLTTPETPDNIQFGEDGRLIDADGESIATS